MHSTDDYEYKKKKKRQVKCPLWSKIQSTCLYWCPNLTPSFLRKEVNVFFMTPKAILPYKVSRNISFPTTQDRNFKLKRHLHSLYGSAQRSGRSGQALIKLLPLRVSGCALKLGRKMRRKGLEPPAKKWSRQQPHAGIQTDAGGKSVRSRNLPPSPSCGEKGPLGLLSSERGPLWELAVQDTHLDNALLQFIIHEPRGPGLHRSCLYCCCRDFTWTGGLPEAVHGDCRASCPRKCAPPALAHAVPFKTFVPRVNWEKITKNKMKIWEKKGVFQSLILQACPRGPGIQGPIWTRSTLLFPTLRTRAGAGAGRFLRGRGHPRL